MTKKTCVNFPDDLLEATDRFKERHFYLTRSDVILEALELL
jgi:metal-responsive CopG/Arc/MetJ family transcriptional regulator